MKAKLSVLAFFFVIGISATNAQFVKLRIGLPVGISIRATSPRPWSNAIWVGPEWQWRGGRYECVPGYWAKPHHYGAIWVPGHWKSTRRGEIWVSGHWK
jgi:hypothetical protein